MKVINNFLDKKFFSTLQSLILNDRFPWFFNNYKVYENDNDFQFTHTVIKKSKTKSNFINYINPILNSLKAKEAIQVKLNLQTKTDKIYNHIFHTDIPNVTTAIFYINTNNGKTIFKNGKEISSVENRMIIFNSNLK